MTRRSVWYFFATMVLSGSMLWGQTSGSSTAESTQDTKVTKEDGAEEEMTAKVTQVIDGDSIKVRGADGKEYEVQIEGTDAPESKQEYGKESTEALKKMLFDSDVRVTWKKKDNFERLLAQVYRGDKHINAEMIKSGNAWHFKRYNQSKALADLEVEAKKDKRGLWKAETPTAPWDYRKENRTPDKPDR